MHACMAPARTNTPCMLGRVWPAGAMTTCPCTTTTTTQSRWPLASAPHRRACQRWISSSGKRCLRLHPAVWRLPGRTPACHCRQLAVCRHALTPLPFPSGPTGTHLPCGRHLHAGMHAWPHLRWEERAQPCGPLATCRYENLEADVVESMHIINQRRDPKLPPLPEPTFRWKKKGKVGSPPPCWGGVRA